jgi:hypothetical protein
VETITAKARQVRDILDSNSWREGGHPSNAARLLSQVNRAAVYFRCHEEIVKEEGNRRQSASARWQAQTR